MLKVKCLIILLGRRVLLAFGISVLLVVLFIGMQSPRASAASWSFVRVFHAAPDAGVVAVFMDGSKILSNFQYGTLTGYIPVAGGSHTIQIAVIGKGVNAAILSQTISLQAGVPYTVVVLGTHSSGFSLHDFADNNSVTGNRAKVRVYQMSPGTGTVDVNAGGNTLISGLPYAQASNYVSITPGSYMFDVTATQHTAASTVPVKLSPWTVTSIFAFSQAKSTNAAETLQFVQAQITGMPGMPGTGSDPTPLSQSAPSSPAAWPLAGTILALLAASAGAIVVTRRARGKAFRRVRSKDTL